VKGPSSSKKAEGWGGTIILDRGREISVGWKEKTRSAGSRGENTGAIKGPYRIIIKKEKKGKTRRERGLLQYTEER